KGVGRSTAAAIAAFAFGRREAILDGNVKRVLCRVFAQDGAIGDKKFETALWDLAESLLPAAEEITPYTQGLMDLGALVCKRSKPRCDACPMAKICLAKQQGRIAKLPHKKTAVAVKEVALYWLVLRDKQGRVLLEKRPSGGIWGGLYCVPCFERLDDLYERAAALGVAAEDLAEGDLVSHRLTHRLLQITPLQANGVAAAATHGSLWANAAEYGLPKPLAEYLRRG
ncbi:MAG: NUDIX domain-containing protein, partial [Eikenella corrodens]